MKISSSHRAAAAQAPGRRSTYTESHLAIKTRILPARYTVPAVEAGLYGLFFRIAYTPRRGWSQTSELTSLQFGFWDFGGHTMHTHHTAHSPVLPVRPHYLSLRLVLRSPLSHRPHREAWPSRSAWSGERYRPRCTCAAHRRRRAAAATRARGALPRWRGAALGRVRVRVRVRVGIRVRVRVTISQ